MKRLFTLSQLFVLSLVWPVASALALPPGVAAPADVSKPASWVAAEFSVTVYCGATDRADPKYAAMATQVGAALAARHWTLVWGGSKIGLMGAVARGAKEAGGRVVGVLPEFIRDWEVAYTAADEMLVVTTMAERKLILQTRADAFVVLPGGIGTFDELAEALNLRQLGRHRKPIILLNQDGYFDALLAFLDHTIAEKFSGVSAREQLAVARDLGELMALLEQAAKR